MNERIKNALGVAGVVALLFAGYAAVAYTNAYSSSIEPGSYRSFSVSGEGKVVVVPDIAQMSFSVLTEGGTDLGALQTRNTTKVNSAIEFVKGKGVDAKDIKTESYSVSPRYQTYNCNRPYGTADVAPCPPAEIVGYSISQTVSVKVRDFTKIGDILSGVVTNGANQVYGPNFTVDDPTKPRNDARAEAIKKAQESAVGIANAGGFSLGRLLGIDESGGPIYYDRSAYGMGGAEAMKSVAAAPAPAIEAGSQDVTVSVTLRYEIR